MKIKTLIKRENFKKILEDTLTDFFQDLNGKPYKIKFNSKPFKINKFNKNQFWYCNPLINSIFVKNVNSKVFESINGEYYFNPVKPWKSYFQRIYLIISQSKLLRTYFSSFILEIFPKINNSKNKIIIGGNKKIRLIDIKKKEVYVILKKGFNKKFIKKDKYVRENFDYLPLPKIKKKGIKNFWYSEEYIVGVPPNRLNYKLSLVILEKAILNIRKLNYQTTNKVDLNLYVKKLEINSYSILESIPCIDSKLKNRLIKVISIIVKALNDFKKKILISYCHGDFHQGNILSNGDNYWILDWENSGKKQIGYDLFIYLLDTRVDNEFSKNMMKLFNFDLSKTKRDMISFWPELIDNNLSFKREYLFIFLIEDLIFYLDEINNKLFNKNPFLLKNRIIKL